MFDKGIIPASFALVDASPLPMTPSQLSRHLHIVGFFDDLSLIVLTAKGNDNPGWPEWQIELLQLSSNSQHLFAEKSGHTIQRDEPDAAVAAILHMFQQVRR